MPKKTKNHSLLLQVIAPLFAAIASYYCVPISVWDKLSNGLLTFLGILVAALVQVIALTSSFGFSHPLPTQKTKLLIVALEKQQKLWLAMLCVAFLAAFFVVIGSAVASHEGAATQEKLFRELMSPFVSSAIAFLLSFLGIRSILIIPGILSLQRLKGRLELDAAKSRERGCRPASTPECHIRFTPAVPDDFGKKVRTIEGRSHIPSSGE